VAYRKPEPPVKMKLRRGDKVQVLSGKERGRTGEVTRVYPDTNRVLVEGLNIAKKHQRQTSTRLKGGIIDKEMPLHASSVAIVCSTDGPTRIAYEFDSDGTKHRVCVHCRKDI
jgi:large subunit ribosomal protein L24